jgi:hypothetical protein
MCAPLGRPLLCRPLISALTVLAVHGIDPRPVQASINVLDGESVKVSQSRRQVRWSGLAHDLLREDQ